MKRDVQVGVTLGVIILAIIGVFLSTRTPVKEPTIPIPEIEEDTQVGQMNVNELSPEPQYVSQESIKGAATTGQSTEQKASSVTGTNKIAVRPAEKQDNVIEGEWKKAKEKEAAIITASDAKPSAVSEQEDWKTVSTGDISKAALRTYKVQYNDSLRKIANKYYGDESKWLLIFNANQNKIQDRNSLRIGTELIIPEEKIVSQKSKGEIRTETTTPALSQVVEMKGATSSVKKHTVQAGDTLYTLAVKYYKDGTRWNKIFDANKKNLKGKKSLKVGQELVIPNL